MISKKNMLIIAGLAVGGLGVASMMAEDGGGENITEQIKQRAGNILGGETTTTTTTTTGAKKDALVTEQQPVIFGAFPTDEDVFGQDPITETSVRPVAQRGGGGGGMTSSQRTAYDIMSATAMGGGVYTPPAKKEPYDPSLLAIAPAGVAGKGAIQAAAVTEAQRVSRAGVAGGGALTSFLKDVGGFIGGTPSRISTAGVAGKGAISSAISGVTGISKKDKGGYRGSGMTQSEYKSLTAHRTYSSPATAKKTSTDASKAISHAKRLRAGRGD